MGITAANIILATAFGAAYVRQSEGGETQAEYVIRLLDENHEDAFGGEGTGDESRSPYEVGLECRPAKFALLFSNFADKYVSFKVGCLWRNTGSESIRVGIEQINFSVGGITQDQNEIRNCPLFTVPPGGEMVQILGGGWSKVLWNRKGDRNAVRGFLAGTGSYKDFNASGEYWAEAYFSATYRAVATLTGLESDIMSVANQAGTVRYLSHRNIGEFDRLMQDTLTGE